MPELVCKQCGEPILDQAKHIGNWGRTTHEMTVRRFECTPDGTGIVNHVDAGTFCSPECMMRYLMMRTGMSEAVAKVRETEENLRALLMIVVDDYGKPAPRVDSGDGVRRMEKERVDALKAAWAEIDRILQGQAKPRPFMPDCGGDFCEMVTAGADGRCGHIKDCRDAYEREAKPDA